MTPLTDNVKNLIGKRLTNRLGSALEHQEIDPDHAATVCDMILASFETMKYQEDIIQLLEKLSSAWPFFHEILDDQVQKKEAINSIDSLFKDRNIKLIGSSAGR